MKTIKSWVIEETLYELYQAASGDYCVTVSKYAQGEESYNLGSLENALKFILSHYECEDEEE